MRNIEYINTLYKKLRDMYSADRFANLYITNYELALELTSNASAYAPKTKTGITLVETYDVAYQRFLIYSIEYDMYGLEFKSLVTVETPLEAVEEIEKILGINYYE